MREKYDYLKKYIPGGSGVNDNWFMPINLNEIEVSEKHLGFSFPSELREFYQEIGQGMLRSPKIVPEKYDFNDYNEILPPHSVANFALGILEWEGQQHWMAREVFEDLEEGDLPFFEIGDSSSFMIMKAKSENPNAIWYMGVDKIEDSFERFIWRLYHESPKYYLDLI